MSVRACIVFFLGLCVLPGGLDGASFPTEYRFRSLSTPRVTIHFHQGLEASARHAAALATQLLDTQTARYGVQVPRVHIVLSDEQDSPNGFATPLPYPLVGTRAAAPDGTDAFGNYDDWLRLLLSHELAHIVHLEQARGLPGFGRKLLGRAPYLFPNVWCPTWLVEGLATYEETEATAFGRGRDPDSQMVLRAAALAEEFPRLDQAVAGLDARPGGHAPYLFGESFLRELSEQYGEGVLSELARANSGNIIPFLDELTAHRVTGASFRSLWRHWSAASRRDFQLKAARISAEGVTSANALTARGVRQVSPRFSPDGEWLAYTSRTLHRYGELRLVRPDGSDDRMLVERTGGAGLAWTPDGRSLVYDEPEVHRHFRVRSDLRILDLESGRARWLTRGARARYPDVSPDGQRVLFVRRLRDRSDLFEVPLQGGEPTRLTHSAPGTQWSGPRFSPDGQRIAASRWLDGGQLDIVLIDPLSGEVTSLIEDRAKDVQPTWTPDGERIVFRSDRDGVSNIYSLRVDGGPLVRLTRVLGGAFGPDVGPQGRRLVFARYSATGYDLALAQLVSTPEPAPPFIDRHPSTLPALEPSDAEARTYRPLPALLPRFWSPYYASISGEGRLGVASGGVDPLFRHAYGLALDHGLDSRTTGGEAYYQYDRLYPTLAVRGSSRTKIRAEGLQVRDHELTLSARFPLVSTFRHYQWLTLAYRREREVVKSGGEPGQADLGGLEVRWALSTARRYPYSISRVDGFGLQASFLKEDPALGSQQSLGKLSGDARAYIRLSEGSQVLALRLGGGTTFGQPGFTGSYAIGGFADAGLFTLVGANQTVLRGYPDKAFEGRHFLGANAEYRFPLGHPQRGLSTLPFFLRHFHAALFVDAGHAWSEGFRVADLKTAVGVSLGTDVNVFHGLPMTASVGVAHGFADRGETRAYFRLGATF